MATTKIYVAWKNIPLEHANGDLKGYHVKYKKYFDKDWTVRFIDIDKTFGALKMIAWSFLSHHIEKQLNADYNLPAKSN